MAFEIIGGVLTQYIEEPGITDVVIPSGVKCIGDRAFCFNFKSCENIKSVTVPGGVTKIGKDAFYNCTNLVSVSLPDTLNYIGDAAFVNCKNLEYIQIPEKVTHIGKDAFLGCNKINQLTLPSGINKVPEGCFSRCENISKIAIPSGIKLIGIAAFIGCGISSVSLPEGVEEIKERAFRSTERLRSIRIPDSVVKLGKDLVSENTIVIAHNFTPSDFTDKVTKNALALGFVTDMSGYSDYNKDVYSEYLVKKQNELVELIIRHDFDECINYFIDNGYIKKNNICNLMEMASKFSAVNCEKILKEWSDSHLTKTGPAAAEKDKTPIKGIPLNRIWSSKTQPDGTLMIIKYKGTDAEVIVPGEINSKKVTKINGNTFNGADYITSISFSEGIECLDQFLFHQKRNLIKVKLPKSLTYMSRYVFAESGLRKITIPGSVKEIPEYAFNRCSALSKVVIEDGVETICNGAFSVCESLQEIHIPDSVSKIEGGAFCNCKSLQEFAFPGKITTISSDCMYGCTSLKKVTIPDSLKLIDHNAFRGCESLTEINIPGGTIIETGAFSGCSNFSRGDRFVIIGSRLSGYYGDKAEVMIPEGVTEIECNAFKGNDVVRYVQIPEGVETIPESCFEDCKNLAVVKLPDSVSKISYAAFRGCWQLSVINITDSIKEIGMAAFDGCLKLECAKGFLFLNCGFSNPSNIDFFHTAIRSTKEDVEVLRDRFPDGRVNQLNNEIYELYLETIDTKDISEIMGKYPQLACLSFALTGKWHNRMFNVLSESGERDFFKYVEIQEFDAMNLEYIGRPDEDYSCTYSEIDGSHIKCHHKFPFKQEWKSE